MVLVVPATLAVGAATVLTLGVAGRYRHAEGDQQGSGSTLARIREGLAVLWRHPALRPLTVAGAVFNMASTGYSALLVLWAVGAGSAIGLTAQQYAWVAVSMAAGAVVGSVASESLVSRVPELRVGWVIAAATLAVPVLWPEPAVMFGAVAVTGLTAASVNVISQSVRQRLVPARTLGRVTGASRTLGYGLMPLGAMSAGVAAQHWGLAPVMLVAAGLTVLIPLVLATRVRSAMLTVPAT
jgi:hypothetical protein